MQTNTVHVYVCNTSYVVFIMFQGPLGCQSFSGFSTGDTLLHRDIDLFINADVHAEISAISWEATIQRHIEEELHGPLLEVWTFNFIACFFFVLFLPPFRRIYCPTVLLFVLIFFLRKFSFS